MAADISVVIATFRPGSMINDCISALLDQRGPHAAEIIVVDSSADGTSARLRREFPSITVVALHRQTHQSLARSVGIRHATAPFIAITDQDCVPASDWFQRLLSRHNEGHYGAVGGAILNGTPHSIVGTASYLIEFNEYIPVGESRLVPMIPHCNICFRREIFQTVGTLRPVPPGAEDLVFNFLLVQNGEEIMFDPDITVTHQNRTNLFSFFRHQHLLGHGSAAARRAVPMPGRFFVEHPTFCVAMPPLRIARTAFRLCSTRFWSFLQYLLLLPILLPGYFFWASGFHAGAKKT